MLMCLYFVVNVCRAYRIHAYVFAKLPECEYVALLGYPLSPSVAILDQKQCVIHAVKCCRREVHCWTGYR